MSIKIYYGDATITLLGLSQREQATGEVIIIKDSDISLQTTKLAQKVQICKQISLVSTTKEDAFAAVASAYRVVDAAGGLITDQTGRLLMIYRRGKWDLPKGKRERGEKNKECALREVSEECGVDTSKLTIERKAGISYHIYEDPYRGDMVLKPSHWYLMRYSGTEELTPQTEEDIVEAVWLSPKEVEARLKDTHKTLVDIIEQNYLKEKNLI